MVFTSRRSQSRGSPRGAFFRQWIWCQGTLAPLNPSRLPTASLVLFPSVPVPDERLIPLMFHVDTSEAPSLDLSKATKLQDISFRCRCLNAQWIITALRTIDCENIREISLDLAPDVLRRAVHQEWVDLDFLLVQFWTSHSLRLKVMYDSRRGCGNQMECVTRLLPELVRRGIADLVECSYTGAPRNPH